MHSSELCATLYRRCGLQPETIFHVIQECESISLPRTEWHNFLAKQVTRLAREKLPGVNICEEPLFTSIWGTRLKTDIVIESSSQLTLVDMAVACDANGSVLAQKNNEKAAMYNILWDSFADNKGFDVFGMVFRACSMLCPSTIKAAKH